MFCLLLLLTIIGIILTAVMAYHWRKEAYICLAVTVLAFILLVVESFTGKVSEAYRWNYSLCSESGNDNYSDTEIVDEKNTSIPSATPSETIEHNGNVYILSTPPTPSATIEYNGNVYILSTTAEQTSPIILTE